MRLVPGDAARPFVTQDLFGYEVDLNALRRKPLLLSFFRTAACPLCTLRLWYYTTKAADWASRGLHAVAIFESNAEVTARYCHGIAAPFPLIPDPQGTLFRLYDVTQSAFGAALGLWRDIASFSRLRQRHLSVIPYVGKGMFRMPADFLIAPDFTIAYAHYGHDAGDHINFAMIDQFTRKLHPTVRLSQREKQEYQQRHQGTWG
jgi:thioredoxin-dependent peroxiredoxin